MTTTTPTIIRPIDRADFAADRQPTHWRAVYDGKILTSFHPTQWAGLFGYAAAKLYDITALGDPEHYTLTIDGENISAVLNDDQRTALKNRAVGRLHHDFPETQALCHIYEMMPGTAHYADPRHLRMQYLCAASKMENALYKHISHLEGLKAFADINSHAKMEAFAYAAANAVWDTDTNGNHTPKAAYNGSHNAANAAIDGFIQRIKTDSQKDDPTFKIGMTPAEFAKAFCKVVTPMITLRLDSNTHFGGYPISAAVTLSGIKAGVGVIQLERKTGLSATPWDALPTSPTDSAQATIAADSPFTPPAEFEGVIRAVATGFQDTAGNKIPDVYSNEISIQRQARPGG